MPPTNPDSLVITSVGDATPPLPLAYGKLTLECTNEAFPAELQGVPKEILLALSKHTVGRVPISGGEGVEGLWKGSAPIKIPRHYVLNKAYISSMHCRFEVLEDAEEAEEKENSRASGRWEPGEHARSLSLRLTDTSTNGTYVNGTPVGKGKSVLLMDGDLVTLYRPRDTHKPALSYLYRVEKEGYTDMAYRARRHDEASYVRALNAAPSAKPSLGPSVPPSRGPGEGGGVLEETRRRNVELEEKVKALQAEGQEAKAKVQLLEAERREQEASHITALSKLEEELAVVRVALETAETDQKGKGERGKEEETALIAARKEVTALESSLEGLRLRLQERECSVAELQQDKVELEGKVAELGGSLAAERRERERMNTALEKESGRAKSLEGKLNDLKKSCMALEEEAHRVSLDLRQAREEKEEAQRLVDENNNALAGHEAVKGEVMELRTIVENQREEIERKRKELDRLQGHAVKHERLLEEKLAAQQLAKETKEELEAKIKDLDSLTSRVSALQAAVDASVEEVGLLQSSHASLQGKEAQLLADLVAADKRKEGVEEEARVLRDRVSQLETGQRAALESFKEWQVASATLLSSVESHLQVPLQCFRPSPSSPMTQVQQHPQAPTQLSAAGSPCEAEGEAGEGGREREGVQKRRRGGGGLDLINEEGEMEGEEEESAVIMEDGREGNNVEEARRNSAGKFAVECESKRQKVYEGRCAFDPESDGEENEETLQGKEKK